jgi:hypothetical protein
MGEHQRSRQSIGGNEEARQKPTLAALQGSGLGSHWGILSGHLIVIIPSDRIKTRPNPHDSIGICALPDQNATALIGLPTERT